MGARTVALVLSGMLAVYLLLLGRTGLFLLTSGTGVGAAFGLAILVFPFIGAWIIYRELRFGFTAEKMVVAAQLDDAEVDFDSAKEAAQSDPTDWEAWFQVAVAYDEAGDRRQARKSMHHAASLFRTE
jgi:hypothetical protein